MKKKESNFKRCNAPFKEKVKNFEKSVILFSIILALVGFILALIIVYGLIL